MQEIAELFRTKREDSGLSVEEVGKDLGIEPIFIRNIEDGRIGAFQDIFLLREYVASYAKYLGLDANDIIKTFNEYIFEYTSKIPVKEIEKTIKQITKEENNDPSSNVQSPYTSLKTKSSKWTYIFIYFLIFLLVILSIFWSVSQLTINKTNAYVSSYKE